ncbi:translocation/assembly module TamB domain-containing protein [Waterburya agarophytonicola K14]|uniref:Translocation/assembly module TamB domain-containing protein n=1 Tax=Waterburya agarophytonicola KI4 TaxID=2874699 RepID=A0A964FE69_9CYAN|nr:translocation/assembly module TamB domain-containing protein [Waterburya agarophytonicola KI4]
MNQPPNPEPEKSNPFKWLVSKLKASPKKTASGIVAIAALGSLGYWGLDVLVKKKLPPFLETQISKFVERPIDLGEVEGFSLSGIEFGKTVIPPTATDPDKVSLEGVKVGFNLLPVLFRRTLPLDVTLTQPDIYLEQERDGEWINLDFLASDEEKKDPLLYFDVDIDVDRADITAVPYEQNPLKAQVDGRGRFNQKEELLEYDLDAGIEEAKASVKGNTALQTGTTDTKLLVEDLALTDVATLLPIPVEIGTGKLNAELDIKIPSWDKITAANIRGEVNLQNVTGEVTDLDTPISAESKLNFSDRNAEIEQTQATFGDITAQVDGQVNLDSGYDVEAVVLPFQIASLPPALIEQLPVPVAGEVEAQVKLRGAIKEPKLTGNINNTQTITLDKTQFKRVNADFRADLAKVVLENVQIDPVAGGSILAEGTIETNIQQALSRDSPISINNMPLAFSFKADLPTQELVAPYYELPQDVTVGNLDARGQIDGTVNNPKAIVKWDLAEANAPNLEDIAGSGTAIFANNNLSLQDTTITYGDGKADLIADANLSTKQWQADINANSLNLTPFLAQVNNPNLNLNRPLSVETAKINLNGKLDRLDPEKIRGTADLNLNVDGGDVAVNSQLNNGNIVAKAVTNNIAIDNFVPSLPVSTKLQSGTINASGKLKQLLEIPNNGNVDSLKVDVDLNLTVDGEAVAVNSQIDSGIVQANANTSQINLNRVAPNLPIPANLRSSKVTASAELQQLLAFSENPNLSTVDATLDADLDVAAGTIKAIASLDNNQWQANLNANNISSQLLLDKFAPENLAAIPTDNINAQADLTGDINPLLNNNNQLNVPITVNQLAVNSGEQRINAKGNLTLTDVTNNLDVTNTDLDVAANIDFDRLPIKEILTVTTQDNQLIAESVNIKGKAVFDGQFNGKQLLSAPSNPENINLTGDLSLQNFAFNDIVFDPAMAGNVTVQPGKEIALNLQGKQDVIAATAVPCTESDCKLPYLPNNLEFRQGENTDNPIIATGNRNGDKFSLDIKNFPLALLNIAPAKSAGIEGKLAGTTTGNVDLDLYTLAAEGDIAINNPGVGYIQADNLKADFNYDPVNNIAELTSSSLNLGDSEYNLNAALNLESGQIDGKLNIPEAYIQDILTTFRWFTIEDVTNLFNIADYADPNAVKPAPEKDLVDRTIARKLNQLRIVNRKIQANAAAKEKGNIPSELDVEGKYTGEIIIGGTIQTPEADFQVEGNDWQWQPTQAYPNIVPPLGLVIEESQYISIPKLLVKGKLQGTEVDLAKAELQVQEAAMSLRGKLSPEQFNTKFAVANLTIDNIANFVDIPVDLAGEINTVGTLKGTIEKPELAGKIAFTEGAFNGNILPAEIAGNYDYDGTRLGFDTTAPDSIRVEASVPYPIIPGKSDRFTAKADLDKEAFVFLDAFSQNYLNWIGGGGDANLEAKARLDLDREGIIYDLDADGVINLENANIGVETPFFSEKFIGTGKITLKNQIINVETLDGIFAEKDLSVTGKLPILKEVKSLDKPLSIDLPPGEIDIKKLYKGGVEGKVTVTGASLKPVIGGKVNLENGKISIPKTEKPEEDAIKIAPTKTQIPQLTASTTNNKKAVAKASGTKSTTASSSFVTALDNLQINLKEFKLEQAPLYKFQLDGGLTLNGTVDEPRNIIPKGTLQLTTADVNLFSNSFELARNLENTIVFTPEAGVFNPTLYAVLETEVEDFEEEAQSNSLFSAESNSNEIDDPITNTNNSETIQINLAIDGQAEEILPNLAQTSTNCNIRPNDSPLLENSKYYSQTELNRLTQCFNEASLSGINSRELIDSTAVQLTSTPSLDRGEIVGLLSNKFLAFAENTISGGGGEGLSQSRLFDIGVQRFIVSPIIDRAVYQVEDTTVAWGKKVGLHYFTVYPNVEGTYEINKKSSLRFTYDYNILANVSDVFDDDTTTNNEIRVLYELNFK